MGAYGYMDKGFKGMASGYDCKVNSYVCADSNGLEFGKAVFAYVGDTDQDGRGKAYNFYNDTAKLAFDADFVTSNTIDITVNTVAITQVTFTTDHDTTAGLVRDAIAALTGVECVLDSTDVNNRTFLIRAKGTTIAVTEDVQAGASQATGTITYDSGQVFVGIAQSTQKEIGSSAIGYSQYDQVNTVERGTILVLSKAIVSAYEAVYIDNSGADIGEFSNAGLAVNAIYRENAIVDGLVDVEVVGKTNFTYALSF